MICLICGKSDLSSFGMFHHIKKKHKILPSEYESQYKVVLPKFSSWNVGLTKETSKIIADVAIKSSNTQKYRHSAGELTSWQLGYTKDTHPSLKKSSDSLKGHKIFIDPQILGKINKERLTGKSWEEIYGENKAHEMKLKCSGDNNIKYVKRETRLCACGCGSSFVVKSSSKQRFIYTHNTRKEHNPRWLGGLHQTNYAPGFTKKLRRIIIERDKCMCQICCTTISKKFDVHHIDYNKTNHNLNNLILLCAKCHATTNSNRVYWKSFLQGIIDEYKNY